MDSTDERRAALFHQDEAKFSSYIHHSPDGVFVTDESGRFIEVNPAASKISGYSAEELLEMSVSDLHLAELAHLRSKDFQSLKEDGSLSGEFIFVHKDGTHRWWSLHAVKISDTRYLGFVRDVTDRKRVELELVKTRELFRLFIKHSPIYSFIKEVTPTESRTLYASDNYEIMIGLKGSDMVGKTMAELFPAEFAEKMTADDWTVVSKGEVLKVDEDFNGSSYTTIKAPLVQGEKTLLIGYTIDITDRKRAEEALRESEERHRRLLENLPVGVYRSTPGPDGRFIFANPFIARMFEYDSVEEFLRTPVVDLYQDAADRRAFSERLVALGRVQRVELRLKRKGGTPIWGSVTAQAVRDARGDLTYFDGFIEDITERKRAEGEKALLEAQLGHAQKMESVGQLAGGVAHDFNNMLAVILGRAEMALLHVEPSQPLHKDLTEIRKAAERSAELTRQLLAFAREQTVAPRVLDLNETIAATLKMLSRLIGEHIELTWLPGSNLWPVLVDPSQVDQILANLCVNARDAIDGVGRITIKTENATFDVADCARHLGSVPGEYVRLAVSDNGCGMDRETLAHVFEPFFTTKGVGRGTGLGLSTVYGAVRQNNGLINAQSEPGRGTVFTIYLPRHLAKPGEASAEGLTRPLVHGQETILLVEDEPAILNMTKGMLADQGYTVLTASTPGEAIRLAGEYAGEIHLLMTDVVMPEMNGRDLAEDLLSLYPNLKRLFMSGYAADVIAHHGVLDEGVNFIQKPFSLSSMAAKIRQVLDG